MCTSAVVLVAAGGGLAVAATGASIRPLGLDGSHGPRKAAALQRLASVAATDSSTAVSGPPAFVRHPIPARMLGPEAPVPIPPSVLRVRNAWLVSDGRTLVAVYAGAAGNDPARGRLVIVRQDLVAGRQTLRTIDCGPIGPLEIRAAPLGVSAERAAQAGSIALRASSGARLRLDVGADRLRRQCPLPLTRPSRTAGTVARP